MNSWVDRSLSDVHIQELTDRGPIYDSYLGKVGTTNQPVTVRIFHAELPDDPASVELLGTTSRLLTTMAHPNISRVLNLDIADNHPYLVEEQLAGISLHEYLHELSRHGLLLPVHIIARLFNPIASAIDYAHARGILHRNLNPSNVILRPTVSAEPPSFPLPAQFHPVVANFSLSHILGVTIENRIESAYSNPSYLSPEQTQGEMIDKRTDIYSLGVLLFEMISGSSPEPRTDALADPVHFQAAIPMGNVAPAAADAVQRAMSREPNARFQRAIDLADEFEIATGFKPGPSRAVPDTPRSAPPPTLKMKAPQRSRERIIALVFTIFVVILGLSTLGILAYLASRFLGSLGQSLPILTSFGIAGALPIQILDSHNDKT